MSRKNSTQVQVGEHLNWIKFSEHHKVSYRELVRAEHSDALGIMVSSVLWEKIEVGGAVLPHYHDVAEIIHITVGKVKLLLHDEWKSFQAGDTFLVPAGVVHSVKNDDITPTEQISMFVPVSEKNVNNEFFKTYLINP